MGSKEGSEKAAAKKTGVSYAEWNRRRANGKKWCTKCKTWLSVHHFNVDASRSDGLSTQCIPCRRVHHRKHSLNLLRAPSHEIEVQATNAVKTATSNGTLPRITSLKCTDCDEDAQHYHHHLGYQQKHWLNVVPLCVSCHRKRHWG